MHKHCIVCYFGGLCKWRAHLEDWSSYFFGWLHFMSSSRFLHYFDSQMLVDVTDVLFVCSSKGSCVKSEEEEAASASSDSDPDSSHGTGVCKWFNVRMGFGFLSMSHREGVCLDSPVDVFVHQVRCVSPHISQHYYLTGLYSWEGCEEMIFMKL